MLFIPIAGGIPNLYQWADPEELARDPHLNEIAHSYLNVHGFVYRAIAYFVIWAFLIFLLNRWSTEQDERSFDTLRFRQLSAPGLILYAFTISFAAIDWVMSLQARWISTIYGLLFLVGQGLSALCFLIIIETILSKRKPVSDYLKPTEIHDHAKLTLAFVMWSMRYGKPATDNPWSAAGLEWMTSSPPPTFNFDETPVVNFEAYDYEHITDKEVPVAH